MNKINKKLWSKMLTLSVFSAFMILGQELFAQEKIVDSKVSEVKIYSDGAMVTRTSKTEIGVGTTLLIFENISDFVDESSIQLMTNQRLDILSIEHRINNNKEAQTNAKIKKLNDSLDIMRDYLKNIEIQNSVMASEEEILKANKSLGGSQQGVSSTELQKILDLNRTRLTEIQTQRYKNTKLLTNANKIITSLNLKIAKEKKSLPTARGEILVMVSSINNRYAEFELNYFTGSAGWTPIYDIKTDGPGSKTTLAYKAEIYQSSGEIWDYVKLSVSSAQPLRGINIPKFETEYLSLNQPAPPTPILYKGARRDAMSVEDNETYYIDGIKMQNAPIAEVSSTENIFEFTMQTLFSIPSNGNSQIVKMKEYELDIDFEYYSIPKEDPSVFLTGIATNWKGFNIISGAANMYLGESYVGQYYINPSASDDSLRLSFGKDRRVSIERNILNDFSKKSLIGSSQKQTYSYEIVINNSRNTATKIRIIDQIPISKNSEIKVDTDDISGGSFNKNNGAVEWEFELKANENKKLKLVYTVTSPKSKNVYRVK